MSNALGALVEIPPYFLLVLLLDPWGRSQKLLLLVPVKDFKNLSTLSSSKPDDLCLWFASCWLLSPVLRQLQAPKAPPLKQHLLSSVPVCLFASFSLFFFSFHAISQENSSRPPTLLWSTLSLRNFFQPTSGPPQ